MPGEFGIAAAALALAVVLVLPSGRAMLAGLFGSVARWPALIRAELRGAAPLRVDGPGDDRFDTTPDIPAVTRGLPVVERPDRV